jgi:hypothetical protein
MPFDADKPIRFKMRQTNRTSITETKNKTHSINNITIQSQNATKACKQMTFVTAKLMYRFLGVNPEKFAGSKCMNRILFTNALCSQYC